MRAWPVLAVAALLALTMITAWSSKPAEESGAFPLFEPGETWVYDVYESWTGTDAGSATWSSTLRVQRTNMTTSTGPAALIESKGAWISSIFGPTHQTEGAKVHGYALVDPFGWRIVGRGYLRESPPAWLGEGPDPCAGHVSTAEYVQPYPALVPIKVLRGEKHNGSWEQAALRYEYESELIEETREAWDEREVDVMHLRTVYRSIDGRIRTEVELWYAPSLDGILRAQRWTNRAVDGGTSTNAFAHVELREHRANDELPPLAVAARGVPIPDVPDLAIASSKEAVDVSFPNATAKFWLVQAPSGARWRPDAATVGIHWRLSGPHVIHDNYQGPSIASSEEAEAALTFADAGPYNILARVYPKACILQPQPDHMAEIGDLKRLSEPVPTFWERNWSVAVNPGRTEDILLDELELTEWTPRVIAFVERVGVSTGASTDDGSLVLRTVVNNDFPVPVDDLPPGTYGVVWRPQGAGGGPVVGDDWHVTLRFQYFR